MARPTPIVIDSYPDGYFEVQVLSAAAIYAVFYRGKPINICRSHTALDRKKYPKVSFSNIGYAYNLADKLNKIFKTDQFNVYELSVGHIRKEVEDV